MSLLHLTIPSPGFAGRSSRKSLKIFKKDLREHWDSEPKSNSLDFDADRRFVETWIRGIEVVLAINKNDVELYFTYFAWYGIRQCRTFSMLIQRAAKN